MTVNANTDLSRDHQPRALHHDLPLRRLAPPLSLGQPAGRPHLVHLPVRVSRLRRPAAVGAAQHLYVPSERLFPSVPHHDDLSPTPAMRSRQSTFQSTPASHVLITDPFGNQTQNIPDRSGLTGQTQAIKDPRGVRTSFTYQLQNNGAYRVSGIQKTGLQLRDRPGPVRLRCTTATTRSRRWSTRWATARPWCGTAWATGRR